MQSKCLIEFCNRTTTKTSRIVEFNCLCRIHQVDVAGALMLHLPKFQASSRQIFMRTPQGRTWFMDRIREIDGFARARLNLSYMPGPGMVRHPFQATTPEEALKPTPAIPTPQYHDLVKAHPNPKPQVFPTLVEQRRKK